MRYFSTVLKQVSFLFVSVVLAAVLSIYTSQIRTPTIFTDSTAIEREEQYGFPFPVFYLDSGCVGGNQGCIIGEVRFGIGDPGLGNIKNNETRNFLFYFILILALLEVINKIYSRKPKETSSN